MGHPRATSSNRNFAKKFANCVTVCSAHKFDWIARRGWHEIFEFVPLGNNFAEGKTLIYMVSLWACFRWFEIKISNNIQQVH
jgi:hypothetical protein